MSHLFFGVLFMVPDQNMFWRIRLEIICISVYCSIRVQFNYWLFNNRVSSLSIRFLLHIFKNSVPTANYHVHICYVVLLTQQKHELLIKIIERKKQSQKKCEWWTNGLSPSTIDRKLIYIQPIAIRIWD